MKIREISFVCYPVKDVKRARKFYEGVLGLKPGSEWVGEKSAFIEYEMGSHTLAIGMGADNFKPSKTGPCAALEVVDFKSAMKELKKKKVKFIMEPLETSVCWMALIADTEGNQIMIHHRKKK